MDPLHDRDELRKTLAAFDKRQKMIVGGMIAIMIDNPTRIREPEWLAEQFTAVTLLAGGFDDVASAQEALERVQAYAKDNIDAILNACMRLFACVADDMAARGKPGTREEAVARALDYFGEDLSAQEPSK